MDPTTTAAIGLYKTLLIVLSVMQVAWGISWIIARWTQRQEISNVELGRRMAALELKPDAALMDRDIRALHTRMDRAGREASNFGTRIQGMESRFREIFLTRELADQINKESREDRTRIWLELDQITKESRDDRVRLWSEVNYLKSHLKRRSGDDEGSR